MIHVKTATPCSRTERLTEVFLNNGALAELAETFPFKQFSSEKTWFSENNFPEVHFYYEK